jgi:predicted RNA methylase
MPMDLSLAAIGLNTQQSVLAQILGSAAFRADLTHSLVLDAGTGTPTFTRATTETGQRWDESGYLDFTALAGEIVFKGARRVYNLCPTSSASVAVAANKTITASVGVYVVSMGAGTGTLTFTGTATGSTGTLAASASARNSAVLTITVAGTIIATASVATCVDIQFENVTGQTTQTASEYVSVGVESAPAYHGSMVDGVKCYDTDRSGNPITTTTTYDAVTLNGVAGTYVSTPDSVANSITGSFDVDVYLAAASWTPSTNGAIIAKDTIGSRQFAITITATTGLISCLVFDSAPNVRINVLSSVAPTVSAGQGLYIRTKVTWVLVGNHTVDFYTSTDGITWTPLGTQQTAASSGGLAINDGGVLTLGQRLYSGAEIPLSCKIYRARLYNGDRDTGGTLAVDFDASRYAGGTTLTGSTGETWTLQGNAVIHPTNYPIVGYVPWEARTNLCLYSTDMTSVVGWTSRSAGNPARSNNLVGPDGVTNSGCSITNLGTSGVGDFYQAVGVAGVALARAEPSFYAKAITTSGTLVVVNAYAGDDGEWRINLALLSSTRWERITRDHPAVTVVSEFVYHATLGLLQLQWYTLSGTIDVGIYGPQLENGSFATPYIPTTTVAVARNADVLTYTGADVANIKTLAATFSRGVGVATSGVVVEVNDNTANELATTYLTSATAVKVEGYHLTSVSWSMNATYTPGTQAKTAQSFIVNDVKVDFNGTALTPDTTAAMPVNTQLNVGHERGSFVLNGPVNHIYGWTRNFSQSELGAIDA